jgi:hypothetical protein
MLHWSIFAVSLYAFGMSIFFASSARMSPEVGRTAIPASIALTTIGLLGVAVGVSIRSQHVRLRQLEEQLREQLAQAKPTAAANVGVIGGLWLDTQSDRAVDEQKR